VNKKLPNQSNYPRVMKMIGERLKEQRIKNNARQQDLAAAIGVQTSMISRYETNRDDPSDNVKVGIARFLGVSIDYLLGLIDEPVPYYDRNQFIILADTPTDDERLLLLDFVAYLKYRRGRHSEKTL